MPDYIKRSPEIHEWLTAQGITVEPDGNAPKVYSSSFTGELYVDYRRRNTGGEPDKYEGCFYGPGGEGNLLKALRGYEKTTSGIFSLMSWTEGEDIEAHWTDCMLPNVRGKGKTDGIALAELLWKIKEASE